MNRSIDIHRSIPLDLNDCHRRGQYCTLIKSNIRCTSKLDTVERVRAVTQYSEIKCRLEL